MNIPQTIHIKSDNNQLKYITTLKGKEDLYVYEYVVSETKLGIKLSLSERELEKLTKNEVCNY